MWWRWRGSLLIPPIHSQGNSKPMSCFAKLSGLITLFASLCCSAAAQTYTYETISYPGAIATYIDSMNKSAPAVGCYFNPDFLTHGASTTVDLGSPSAGQTYLTSINAQGVILGRYADATANTFYEISPNGIEHKLVTKASLTASLGAINDAGNLLGTYATYQDFPEGFLIENGTIMLIAAGGRSTAPSGFNNRDHVVGSSYVDSPYNASSGCRMLLAAKVLSTTTASSPRSRFRILYTPSRQGSPIAAWFSAITTALLIKI